MKLGLIKVEAKVNKNNLDQALEKIKMIQRQLDNGKDFNELAKKYSEGPSAQNGGNLGYFSRGDMVKSFEEAAFNLEAGKISEPVLTKFGYHLIRVDEKKPGEVKASHILIKTNIGEEDKSAAKMIDTRSKKQTGARC